MAEPDLLYCVGATKAGTSWLYRALSEHPQTRMRAVKEAHYWDTFEEGPRDLQVRAFERRLRALREKRVEAVAADRGWQVENLDRQIAEMGRLVEVLKGDRKDDRAYADWLFEGTEGARLVGDLTPSYALLSEDRLGRMVSLRPASRVLYLMRDPLSRLWSHVRMLAERRAAPGEDGIEGRANRILKRAVINGHEGDVTDRGDYAAAVSKLRRVVPEGRLMVGFAEAMFTPEGWAAICRFLGLEEHPAAVDRKVHRGPRVEINEDLAQRALGALSEQYRWVAENVGPLPAAWQANLARAEA